MRARRAGLALALLVTLVAPVARGSAGALTLASDEVLSGDGRLHELTLDSAALNGSTKVRVLLPQGYETSAARYPVLYLLHGASGNERSWTESGGVIESTANLPLIVVMPDGGTQGFYSDWLHGPQWETYHIRELIPFVDARYRTVPERSARAVAGLSMGGYGSMVYASRHPDLFVSAASFSGAVDIASGDALTANGLRAVGYSGDQRWGPFDDDEVVWRDHNPTDLAVNVAHTGIALWTGNGVPNPDHGDDTSPPVVDVLEAGVFTMNTTYDRRLSEAGIAHEYHAYGLGTHEWSYWTEDLREWLPELMATFADPAPPPRSWSYRTAEPAFSVWGWSFTTHRAVKEFLSLYGVTGSRMTVVGSGLVDVVTPAVYAPGERYLVWSSDRRSVAVGAGRDGRLRFTVDLGPSNEHQQYSAEAGVDRLLGLGNSFTTRVVTITECGPPLFC